MGGNVSDRLRVRATPGAPLPIRLTPVGADLRGAARELAPLPEQEPNAGNGRDNLRKADAQRSITACLGLAGGVPVAFFMLQTGMPELRQHLPGDHVVGMRGFFVDRRHQRRGHGGALLRELPAFVGALHPGARSIGLTVNVRNRAAVRAYLRAGFRDTGALYTGGALGPQHILVLDLHRSPRARLARQFP